MTSPTMLLGVEAPAVRPIASGPARRQPAPGDLLLADRRRRRADRPVPHFVGRNEAVRVGDMKGRAPARRRSGRGCRCCCCCSRRRRASGRAAARVEQRDHGVLPFLRRAADRVEGAEVLGRAPPRRSRSRIAARSISPISSDSDISIVVWLAQPMRSRSRSGSKPGETASAEPREEIRRDRRPTGCSRRRSALPRRSSTTTKRPCGYFSACDAVARVSSCLILPWMTAV